jgi:FixJ family two-component response regulator
MHSPEGKLSVVVVDDDPTTRDLLTTALQLGGCRVRAYAGADEFLAMAATTIPDCLLLDVYMPVRSGLDVLEAIRGPDYPAPVIMISARGDIPLVVAAMKAGAYDFIEKPFDPNAIGLRVRETVRAYREQRTGRALPHWQFPGADTLTARETEVLKQVVEGASSKEAGRRLGISPRTIEVHRAQIMKKLGARNTAELMRIVLSGKVTRTPC